MPATLTEHIHETFYDRKPAQAPAPVPVATRLTVVPSFTGRPGAYLVTEIPEVGGRIGVVYPQFYVSPKRVCNQCGSGCEHVQAVERYVEVPR